MATVTLAGSATDDGNPDPPGALTYQWTKVSGPGDVTFVDDTDPATDADFSEGGVYVLRLTVSDGALNGMDEVMVTVSAFVPIPPNTGLRKSMERVGAMSQYHWYRTDDFQTRAIEGGPTWVRHDIAVDDTEIIYSYVVNPFSAGYLADTGEVNAFVATGEAILKVTDLFGVSVGRTTLHTFPVALSADTHWRTIQASFGAYFAEGLNPWIICVSYYGDTVGHTGTWATRSMDGGVTWSSEVQISAHYDTALSMAAPVAVFTSPRTPGFAMTMAYLETDAPAVSDIYITYDWGATWIAASAVVEDPLEPWPIIDPPGGGGGGGSVSATAVGVDGPPVDVENEMFIEAPAGAASMLVRVRYTTLWFRSGGGGASVAGNVGLGDEGLVTHVVEDESTFGSGAQDEPSGGTKLVRWNIGGVGRAVISAHAGANKVGTSIATSIVSVTAGVVSVTREDDTVYEPPIIPLIGTEHGQGGSMHIPWLDEQEARVFVGGVNRTGNRLLTLKSIVGLNSVDASPSDGSRDYGTYFGPFGARTYDLLDNHILLGARGNDTSTGATDDLVGLYAARDGGAGGDWTELLAPVDESNVHMGIQAAFSGTDPTIIFAWGGWTDGALAAIYYSRDGGDSMDSRQGNLAALEDAAFGDHIAFIGIAGGPADDEPDPPEGDDFWYGNAAYYYGDMKAYVLWDGTDVLRTDDIQDAPPVWERIDTGISGTIRDGRYIHIDEDTIGMWLMTDDGIFWCADILAATPSWSNVLPIATVVAGDAAPVSGTVRMQCMDAADDQPGYLIVLTGPTAQDSDYLHAYSWHTHDFGQNWTQIDMNAFTYISDGDTRCYAEAGRFGVSIFRKSPSTIFALRNTARTGSATGRTAVFKSTDLGTTRTKEHEFTNWSAEQNRGSIRAPFPYLNSPSYISKGTTSASQPTMFVSIEEWASGTATTITPPASHEGGFGNVNVIQRVTKRIFVEDHLLAILVDTGGSGGDLYESYDKGVTWETALLDVGNNHTNPNPWPLDPYQWVIIANNDGTLALNVRLTLDNFATLSDKVGNLASVLSGGTWATGLGNGFALPRVGTNA